MIKECSICKEVKQLQKANISKKTGEYGYRSYCESCYKLKKQVIYENNKEVILSKNKEWFKKNPDKRSEISKRYADKNKEKCFILRKKWRQSNIEKARAQVNHRRRFLQNARPKCLTAQDLLDIRSIYEEASFSKMHVDHIVPLQHPYVCGLHVPWNLQLLSPKENYEKSNKFG